MAQGVQGKGWPWGWQWGTRDMGGTGRLWAVGVGMAEGHGAIAVAQVEEGEVALEVAEGHKAGEGGPQGRRG